MTFKKKFYKSVSAFAAYKYFAQGLEFLATIILSRLLLPEEYGFVAIIHVFSGFIQLFSNVGIGQSLVRSDYKYTFHKHLYNLSVWIGIALTLIMMGLSWPISIFFDKPALILPTMVIAFKFFFDSFTYVPYALLSKNLKFNVVGKVRLWATGLQIGLTIVLAYLGFSYWALIIPLIISPVFQFILLRKWVKMPFTLYSWRATKRTLFRIRSLMGNLSMDNFIKYWAGTTDKVVIGRLYTQADLGLYNRAFRFISMTNNLITGIFSMVLFPSLKKLMEEKGDVNKEYMDIIRVLGLLNLPIVFVLMVLPQNLVQLLWGADWIGVATFLPYVGIILFINSVNSPISHVYILYGKERVMLLVNSVNSLLTIALVIAGGLISMMHIIKFLALGFLIITTPLNLYFGFYRSFKYKVMEIARFWLPAMVFGTMLFLSVYFLWPVTRVLSLLLFLLFLLYELRSGLKESRKIIQRKLFFKPK